MQTVRADVLVVGGGAAGARAALEGRQTGATVALAVKGRFAAVGTRGAGASAAATDGSGGLLFTGQTRQPPAVEEAYKENLQLGLGLSDPRLARVLVEDATRIHSDLATLNIYPQSGMGRGVNSHGVPLVVGLAAQARSRGVQILEGLMVARLLLHDGEVSGALAVDEASGDVVAIEAPSIVLATGGDGQLFRHNLNPSCVTGDGYYLGYEAGALLMNLEFKQVFTMAIYPTRNILHLWTWKQQARLLNARQEEFLGRWCPPGVLPETVVAQHAGHDPASTRDSASRYLEAAIIGEVGEGRGTPHGGIWVDARGLEHLLEPALAEWLRFKGLFSDEELIETSVCHQCSNGGFRVDENAQTTVPGLYAIGECMAGAYGADRRGGNMLASTQVFGARAGRHAAWRARQASKATVDDAASRDFVDSVNYLRQSSGGGRPADLKRSLQESNWRHLLFARRADGIAQAQAEINRLGADYDAGLHVDTPRALVEALELRNMLAVSEMLATVMAARTESRGGHYRVDFPERNDREWRKCLTVRKHGEGMELATLVVDPDWHDESKSVTSARWG